MFFIPNRGTLHCHWSQDKTLEIPSLAGHISGRGSTTPESFPWAVDGLMGGYGHYVTAHTVWGVSKDSTKVVVDLRIL